MLRMPLQVGEVVSATVKRKLAPHRVLITFKGHSLVAEPEKDVSPGEEILVKVLSIFPRIRLRLLTSPPPANYRPPRPPLDVRT